MSITHITPREMELQAEVTRLEADELKLHASLAESVLHAQAGWTRYENANNMAKGYQTELAELRAKLAALEAREAENLLSELVFALESTNWSSWQTTAKFSDQFERAKLYLAAGAKP